MEKSEMMKRYESETGKQSAIVKFMAGGQALESKDFPRIGPYEYNTDYIAWLEAKANISEEAIKEFQKIIRNQCDEISALKAQLTWRPVSVKPDKAGVYLVEGKPYTGCESTIITTAYFDGEIFLWYVVVRWLPISPAPDTVSDGGEE